MVLKSAISLLLLNVYQVNALGKLWGHIKPPAYKDNDELSVKVGQLWSLVAAIQPYDFYSLNWCQSKAGHVFDELKFKNKDHYDSDNHDINNKVHDSPYTWTVGEQDGSKVVCNRLLKEAEQRQFVEMIRSRYRYQLFIDGLPNSTLLRDPQTDEHIENFKEGIFVGNHNPDGSIYIHNHLEFIVKVHHVHGGDEVRIVGFEVE